MWRRSRRRRWCSPTACRTPRIGPASWRPVPTPSTCAPCCIARCGGAGGGGATRAGDTLAGPSAAAGRSALLPPALTDREDFREFWAARRPPQHTRRKVEQRMSFAAHLEFGLNSRTGRTLELTGAISVHTDAGARPRLARLADAVIAQHGPRT